MYLSVDGGGSKLSAVLFDEALTQLGRGASGGVNPTQTTLEDCRRNIEDCLAQVFCERAPEKIERLYLTFVGPADEFSGALKKRVPVGEIIRLNEPDAGLLAGALRRDGILALAGTGSDVFYIHSDPVPAPPGVVRRVVGGWGPILGDDGGGEWIGQSALRAVVRAVDGWGEPTLLVDIVRREWALKTDWDMVPIVYRAVAPFRKVAAVTRLVEEAAKKGDKVALDIVREAGELMAEQTLCLIKKNGIPPAHREHVVLAGGAWKTHERMADAFARTVTATYPETVIHKPWFEPVLAGAAAEALNAGMESEAARLLLARAFPEFVIKY